MKRRRKKQEHENDVTYHARDKVCLKHVQTQQQMHTFILGLFEKRRNPSVVTSKRAKRTEMAQT